MSLTALIRDRADVREVFRSRITLPPLTHDYPMLVPSATKSYGLIGTAFDYLLRFHVERLNSSARTRQWIAHQAVFRIELEYSPGKKSAQADAYLREAIACHQEYLRDGMVTDELLRATLRLAHLDIAVRAGPERVDWQALNSPRPVDMAELRALLSVVKGDEFIARKTCILNPTFGAASSLVGGADADLILDDCLVDIKTTKDPRIYVQHIYQLLGYYLLAELGEIEGCPKRERPDIRSLGIYLSRFGRLWKVPVDSLVPARAVPELIRWFVGAACSFERGRKSLIAKLRGPMSVHLAARKMSRSRLKAEAILGSR